MKVIHLYLDLSGFTTSQSRKTSAPWLRPQSSLRIRGLLGEPSVWGGDGEGDGRRGEAGIPTLYSRHHYLFVNSSQYSSSKLTAMTTATLAGVIKRNLIILIKNS